MNPPTRAGGFTRILRVGVTRRFVQNRLVTLYRAGVLLVFVQNRVAHVGHTPSEGRARAPGANNPANTPLFTAPSPSKHRHTHHQSGVRISGHLRRKHSGFIDRRIITQFKRQLP